MCNNNNCHHLSAGAVAAIISPIIVVGVLCIIAIAAVSIIFIVVFKRRKSQTHVLAEAGKCAPFLIDTDGYDGNDVLPSISSNAMTENKGHDITLTVLSELIVENTNTECPEERRDNRDNTASSPRNGNEASFVDILEHKHTRNSYIEEDTVTIKIGKIMHLESIEEAMDV